MNARTIIHSKIEAIRQCEHRTAKLMLAVFTALFSGVIVRAASWAFATFGSGPAWAVEGAERIVAMNGPDFWMAVGLASWGGGANLLHELRANIQKFSLFNATGHMVIAQFAGVSGFLLAIYLAMPWSAGMLVCGLFGWGGNKTLMLLNDRILNRLPGATDNNARSGP